LKTYILIEETVEQLAFWKYKISDRSYFAVDSLLNVWNFQPSWKTDIV